MDKQLGANVHKLQEWSFLNGVKGVYFVGDAGLVKIGWSNDIGPGCETWKPAAQRR
jgi:hypothetical protein